MATKTTTDDQNTADSDAARRGNTEQHTPSSRRPRKRVTEAREEAALALRVKGYTERRIADTLGMSPSSVHEALERAMAKRKLLTDEQLIALKHTHTMILEHKIEEALEAWERSKCDAEAEKVVEKSLVSSSLADDDPTGDKTGAGLLERTLTKTSQGQCGDPRYLAEIRACLADIRKIWGIDAPTKQELSGKDGAPIAMVFTESLTRVYGDTKACP